MREKQRTTDTALPFWVSSLRSAEKEALSRLSLDAWSSFAAIALVLYGLYLLEQSAMTEWKQCEISLKAKPRGCHLVTSEVGRLARAVPKYSPYQLCIVSNVCTVCTGDEAAGWHAQQVQSRTMQHLLATHLCIPYYQ